MIDLPADLAALLRFGDIDPAHVREWAPRGDDGYVVRLDWAPGVVDMTIVKSLEARSPGDRQAGEQQLSPKRRPGAETAQEAPGGEGGSE